MVKRYGLALLCFLFVAFAVSATFAQDMTETAVHTVGADKFDIHKQAEVAEAVVSLNMVMLSLLAAAIHAAIIVVAVVVCVKVIGRGRTTLKTNVFDPAKSAIIAAHDSAKAKLVSRYAEVKAEAAAIEQRINAEHSTPGEASNASGNNAAS